ncbi:protein mono-ADP-ribosyltransferase PARP14-like isoform X2 [Protopterus annectens]|uniref:protein mono-ADP-ribosyltransferase PARP14-like isoform X2 n=1 Tax=Protopterus annectens TaxID=7888 RepID=UPI001CF9AE5D|nr:protein mono-ADP-ribosyltransferase PARP14-like isoform X2 [Protopterus annectens]
MAEGSDYVMVEAEDDLTEKQKNQVLHYFKVKRKSGGGDCVLTQVSPKLCKISFSNCEARQRVLAQREHIVQLANDSIKLTVLGTDDPSVMGADDRKDDIQQAIQREEASLKVPAAGIPSTLKQSNKEGEMVTETPLRGIDLTDKELCRLQLNEYLLNYFMKNEKPAREFKHCHLGDCSTFSISEDNEKVKYLLQESEILNEDCVITKRKNTIEIIKQILQNYKCSHEVDVSRLQVLIKYPNLAGKHIEIYSEPLQQFTVIVGPTDEVADLLKLVDSLLETEKQVEKCSIEFMLPGVRKYLLIKDKFENMMKVQFPSVVCSVDKKRSVLILEGDLKQVYDAKLKLSQTFEELQEVQLTISNNKIQFLSSCTAEEFEKYFSTLSSPVLLEINTTASLCGTSTSCLLEAERRVNSLLLEEEIIIPDTATELVSKPAWKEFLHSLEYSVDSTPKQVNIFSVQNSNNICSELIIVGFKDTVKYIAEAVQKYLSENSIWKAVINVQHFEEVDYFYELLEILNIGDLQITSSTKHYPSPTIELCGPKSKVIEAHCTIENTLKSMVWETLRISKPGALKFFQGAGKEYLSAVGRTMHCLFKLKEPHVCDSDCVHHQVSSSFPPDSSATEMWHSSPLEGGFVVSVCVGHLSKLKVDAIVDVDNGNLIHGSGIAKGIQDAGGDLIEKESQEWIRRHGTLNTGDAVITSAGNLLCQKVIHAVGPQKSEGSTVPYVSDICESLKHAVHSLLNLAEKEGLQSVAFPCMSSGQFAVPLEICSSCIVETIKDFTEEHAMKPHTLKNIILIDIDLEKVVAFQKACEKIWESSSSSPCFRNTTSSTGGPSNIKEVIVSGAIEHQKVDVLVVPLTTDLNLMSTMVSKCILLKAGDNLRHQFFIQSQGRSFEPGDIVPVNTSEIPALDCKWLYYVIRPKLDELKGKTKEIFTMSLLHSLEMCHSSGFQSIAFPVIGTGKVLGVSHNVGAKCLLDAIQKFKEKNPFSWIKQISIVIHPKDNISPLLFRNTNSISEKGKEAEGSKIKDLCYHSLLSSIDKASIKICNVKVEVDFGDIVMENVDVIVNPTELSYNTTEGVARSVFSAAGQEIEDQVKKVKINTNNILTTNSGGLKSKAIMHFSGSDSLDAIQKAVKNVIQECEQNNFTSVAFPAIGTGEGRHDPAKVADTMLDAIALAVKNGLIFNLSTIRIVILCRNIFNIFKTKLENRLGMPPLQSNFLDRIGSRLRKSFNQEMPTDDCEIFETKNVITPAIFDVIGILKGSVKNAKERIESIFNDNFSDDCIEDEEIAYLSDTVIQNILQWGAEFNVHITIKKGCTNEIRVQGLTKDVKEVLKAVEIELKAVLKKELDQHHQYQIYQVIRWQYEECNQYSTFDRETNFQIENHFSEGAIEAVVEWNGKSLFMEFQQKIATVLETGDIMNIKRQNRLAGEDFPRNWTEMSNDFIQIPLDPISPEYQDVVKNFQKTAAGYEVVKSLHFLKLNKKTERREKEKKKKNSRIPLYYRLHLKITEKKFFL